jgi:hypothetical protein
MPDPDLERWWLQDVKIGSGGYSASNSVGTGELKLQGSDGDLSPPSRTEFRYQWVCTCTPPICLQGVDKDDFNFR